MVCLHFEWFVIVTFYSNIILILGPLAALMMPSCLPFEWFIIVLNGFVYILNVCYCYLLFEYICYFGPLAALMTPSCLFTFWMVCYCFWMVCLHFEWFVYILNGLFTFCNGFVFKHCIYILLLTYLNSNWTLWLSGLESASLISLSEFGTRHEPIIFTFKKFIFAHIILYIST